MRHFIQTFKKIEKKPNDITNRFESILSDNIKVQIFQSATRSEWKAEFLCCSDNILDTITNEFNKLSYSATKKEVIENIALALKSKSFTDKLKDYN